MPESSRSVTAFVQDGQGLMSRPALCRTRRREELDGARAALSVLAPTVLVVTSPMLSPRTDAELAGLDDLVFVLHAVAAGMPVLPDALVRAVRYGLVHPREGRTVALTPRGVRVLAIAHGEVAAGLD